jgi:Ca2+-transporting ATPase
MAETGPNTVAEPPRPSIGYRVGRQLRDPLVLVLLAAAVTTSVLRDVTDTVVIALVIVVNTVIGVVQEVRADRAVAELNRLAAPTARVVRDGADRLVAAADLVPGDRVQLDAGDVVPADIRLDCAERLRLDEAAVSGESMPVDRGVGDEVSAGTVVVNGRRAGEVVRTGVHSALGRIASLVAATRPGPTPLQRRLARLGRSLGAVAVALSVVVLLIGLVRAGRWSTW